MKIIECPRDAMQGLHDFVPTRLKIEYINQLLKVGFDTIDFGSFVSPKAIPQMKDSAEVLNGLDLDNSPSKLLAIVANKRGAEDAAAFEEIDVLGFPFSISEEFQQRNTGSSIDQSFGRVEEIQNICEKTGKTLLIYISMAFGNPYGEAWDPEIAVNWSQRLHAELGIEVFALSDTIGVSDKKSIQNMFKAVTSELPELEFGAHLHSNPNVAMETTIAAYEAGCRRFDGAIRGFGGCPMAKDDLTGNMPTETMIEALMGRGVGLSLNMEEFQQSVMKSSEIFDHFS